MSYKALRGSRGIVTSSTGAGRAHTTGREGSESLDGILICDDGRCGENCVMHVPQAMMCDIDACDLSYAGATTYYKRARVGFAFVDDHRAG